MKENSVTIRGSPEFVAFMAAEVKKLRSYNIEFDTGASRDQKRPGQCVWYIRYRTLPSGR